MLLCQYYVMFRECDSRIVQDTKTSVLCDVASVLSGRHCFFKKGSDMFKVNETVKVDS